MQVKIKKSENAVTPSYSKEGDAGMDLTATSRIYNELTGAFEYGTSLFLEIPLGYVGLIYPRSSISNYDLKLNNSVGVIDSGYRGEIILKFGVDGDYYLVNNLPYYSSDTGDTFADKPMNIYKVGDRIGQLIIMPYPHIEFEEVEELITTQRGEGGFGSTNDN